ncbi:LacI family DNA-binding transcriptional regulator [Leifsonia sp. AG29]|uniref:LacI family DNA-binding transcriptional regulator n=1 Tax=Leifsonia sp. AG29 TaxID=2598860 RepID=UPI00131CE8A7|nr:LacI family DNA-binding transcriptional regulator [Leifsonia sp. AG29]
MGFVRVADVAAHARVSPGTVSNYFHNPARVAPETAERIRLAIDELGYVPNDAARSLRHRQGKTIGHIAFEVANPYSAGYVHAVDREARARGYTVLNVSSDADHAWEDELLDTFARQRVDGVLLSPIDELSDAARRLTGHGIHLVLADSLDPSAPSVSYDDELGGRLAATHLLELGHRDIAFVGFDPEIGVIERRLTGIREEIAAAGGRLSTFDFEVRSIANGRRVGGELAAMDPAIRPSAVIAVNDLVAVGVLNGVWGRLAVPEDLAIVGFDDIEFASEAITPLTSVARPIPAFAAQSVEVLDAQIRGETIATDPVTLMLAPNLIARESTIGVGRAHRPAG